MPELFKELFEWYNQSLTDGGYPLIILLMAIESSIVPLPSELIIPPAVIAAQTSGQMHLWGIVLAGTFGSWIGASIMYWVSRWAGRPLVLAASAGLEHCVDRWFQRWPPLRRAIGHLFVTPDKIRRAERWSSHYGRFSIFASRILPVVRHLIGIPAGIVRMNFGAYSAFTVLGSGVWCSVLVWVGVQAGKDQALMNGELHQVTLWAVGAIAVLGTIYYFFVHRHLKSDGE